MLPVAALSKRQFALLTTSQDLAGMVALLVPINGEGRFRAIDAETLELMTALREPAMLPESIIAEGDAALQDVARLVLDEIIEVESDGEFVSGPRARRLLLDDLVDARGEGGRLATLSHLAVQRAARSPSSDVDHLGRLLYFAQRVPVTARTWERWPNAAAILSMFARESELDADYDINPDRGGWILWKRRDAPALTGATYKAYVSPEPSELGTAFDALVSLVRMAAPPVLKVGKDAYGLSRPDKFVVYFPSRLELDEFTAAAATLLDGIPAHGVPFTAAVDHDGLVSWGIDPDRGQATRGWLDHESWRMWVTSRIANAVVQLDPADRCGEGMWSYVLGRLAVEGVDPVSWTPPAPADGSRAA